MTHKQWENGERLNICNATKEQLKFYIKKVKQSGYYTKVGEQYIKQTSFWLFGIIPLYIKNEVQKGNKPVFKEGSKMKESIKIEPLIRKFEDMAKRESLLARGNITQNDLLIQIIGTIVHVAMEEQDAISK